METTQEQKMDEKLRQSEAREERFQHLFRHLLHMLEKFIAIITLVVLLAAMGRDPLAIDTAIRVSFCADNTPEDVDAFLNAFEDGMKHLQRIKK